MFSVYLSHVSVKSCVVCRNLRMRMMMTTTTMMTMKRKRRRTMTMLTPLRREGIPLIQVVKRRAKTGMR